MDDILLNALLLVSLGFAIYLIGEHFSHTLSLIGGWVLMSWGGGFALYWFIDLAYFGGSLPLGGS